MAKVPAARIAAMAALSKESVALGVVHPDCGTQYGNVCERPECLERDIKWRDLLQRSAKLAGRGE